MKDEIASWIPENLLHYLESDAERKNMTPEGSSGTGAQAILYGPGNPKAIPLRNYASGQRANLHAVPDGYGSR